MNVGSLFTGVGGFDLGLERAGHTIAFQCEADAKCRQVLRRHWPDVPIYEDVRDVARGETVQPLSEPNSPRRMGGGLQGGHGSRRSDSIGATKGEAPRIDLLCGGFPCQDLSVAGKRAGLAGERSGLFFEATRIADALLGDGGWLLIENVPGLLSSQGGRDFGIVLATLRQLGFLDGAWRVLDSRYFGVPQRRRRVFVLARRARGRRAAEVLLEPESGGGDFAASRKESKDTSRTSGVSLAGTLGSRGNRSHTELDGHGAYVANTLQTTAGDYSRADAGSSPDPDGMREASGIPGRLDGAVSAFDPKPDGPRYAQMGNAVTVQVAEWIGYRLAEFGGEE